MNKSKKNEHLLSVTELKKILKDESKETLMKLIIDSYKAVPQVKEYISAQYSSEDTIKEILEVYKDKVYDIFFPKSMRAQLKLGEAKKVVSQFKKICQDEKLVVDLMLFYVEMGVQFTNTYGDIDERFYVSIESMYRTVVKSINKHKEPSIFKYLSNRLKAVVDNTSGIGWGFHDALGGLYHEIKWLEIEDVDTDENEIKQIKEYISERLGKRKNLPEFDKRMSINEVVHEIIDADEVFLSKMDAIGMGYSNDDEHDFISNKTGYGLELIEFILWQRYCYEMESDYWQYTEGECLKCGSSELYIKEVPNEDFADRVICKMCGTEFIRE